MSQTSFKLQLVTKTKLVSDTIIPCLRYARMCGRMANGRPALLIYPNFVAHNRLSQLCPYQAAKVALKFHCSVKLSPIDHTFSACASPTSVTPAPVTSGKHEHGDFHIHHNPSPVRLVASLLFLTDTCHFRSAPANIQSLCSNLGHGCLPFAIALPARRHHAHI